MDQTQIPILDLNKVLSGGLMEGLASATEQGISITVPPLGIVLGEKIYIPLMPPLPILPVFVVP